MGDRGFGEGLLGEKDAGEKGEVGRGDEVKSKKEKVKNGHAGGAPSVLLGRLCCRAGKSAEVCLLLECGEGAVSLGDMLRRVDQVLGSLGVCARSEARAFLRGHVVEFAGERVVDVKGKVRAGEVLVDGKRIERAEGILVMVNKPTGVVCSHEVREGKRVYDLLPVEWGRRRPVVTSVGRLDKETSGLLLVTDRSELVHLWTSPKNKVRKVYRARLDGEAREEWAGVFERGEILLDGEEEKCAPAELRLLGGREVEVVLTEGKYHQVRRMFAAVGGCVVELRRVAFGGLALGDLKEGEWRDVRVEEV